MQSFKHYGLTLAKWSAQATLFIVGLSLSLFVAGWVAFQTLVFLVQH